MGAPWPFVWVESLATNGLGPLLATNGTPLDVPVMLVSLDQCAVLYALSALGAVCGRGVVGKNDEAAEHGPGEECAQEMLDAWDDFLGEALLQVLVGGHEGGEADFGAYLADESEVIGGGLAFGCCDGPFLAIFLGHWPEADYGYFEGHIASESVDARSNMA